MLIKLTQEPIDIREGLTLVRHPSCGAAAMFEGNIRGENNGKRVLGLEYEVYEKLFYSEVYRIFKEIEERWKIQRAALIQRVGKLEVGESGIFIAAASPHRRDSLEAVSYFIEEFKKRAPVWKKEYYEEDAQWIVCHHGNKTAY